VLVGLNSCSIPTTLGSLQYTLGLVPPLVDNDIPAPSTLSGAISLLALSNTQRLVIREPETGRTQIVTDPQIIQRTLQTLRFGATPGTPRAPTTRLTLQLTFEIRPPARKVIILYRPTKNLVSIYNIPAP